MVKVVMSCCPKLHCCVFYPVYTSAETFTEMVIPEGEAKRQRYGIPQDW